MDVPREKQGGRNTGRYIIVAGLGGKDSLYIESGIPADVEYAIC